MQIPLDSKIRTLPDTPHTISFVVRKRQQLDSFAELPKDKQPPEKIVWEGTPEELDTWIADVFKQTNKTNAELVLTDVEG